jgi:hypothetical protein
MVHLRGLEGLSFRVCFFDWVGEGSSPFFMERDLEGERVLVGRGRSFVSALRLLGGGEAGLAFMRRVFSIGKKKHYLLPFFVGTSEWRVSLSEAYCEGPDFFISGFILDGDVEINSGVSLISIKKVCSEMFLEDFKWFE